MKVDWTVGMMVDLMVWKWVDWMVEWTVAKMVYMRVDR
jgi:hypothetical protein